MTPDPIVTMQDVRASGLCAQGTRVWFKNAGLDFRAFLANGMRLSDVDAIGDAFSARVAAYVRRKEGIE